MLFALAFRNCTIQNALEISPDWHLSVVSAVFVGLALLDAHNIQMVCVCVCVRVYTYYCRKTLRYCQFYICMFFVSIWCIIKSFVWLFPSFFHNSKRKGLFAGKDCLNMLIRILMHYKVLISAYRVKHCQQLFILFSQYFLLLQSQSYSVECFISSYFCFSVNLYAKSVRYLFIYCSAAIYCYLLLFTLFIQIYCFSISRKICMYWALPIYMRMNHFIIYFNSYLWLIKLYIYL